MLLIPDLLNLRRILCIQPHPDDMDIGAGGTLARLSQAGAQIIYLTLTDGCAGGLDPDQPGLALQIQRQQEQALALKTLGITADLHWWDQPDGYLVSDLRLRDRLVRLIREIQPDGVLTVDPWLTYEAHNDHQVTGMLTAQAVFFANNARILPDFPPHAVRALGFFFSQCPNTYVDVSPLWERKMTALQCHQSQFSSAQWPQYAAFFTAQAQAWGAPLGYAYAEAFKVLPPLHLHCFPNAATS